MGEYVLDTGDLIIHSGEGFATNETDTNDYTGVANFWVGSTSVSAVLKRSDKWDGMDASNFTLEEGFIPVRKPYPGHAKFDSAIGRTSYAGKVMDHLMLAVVIDGDEGANVLSNISIISSEAYQAKKSKELASALA